MNSCMHVAQYFPKLRLHKHLLLLILLLNSVILFAEQTLPKEQGLVNDYAGVLSQEEYSKLTQKLRALEDSTGVQIAVVFEESHLGYGAFDRAMFLARGWSVGNKEDRSGILIYIAVNDRDYHIVTSDRTQGKLPDGFIGIVADDCFKPNFRNKNYFEGVNQATDLIIDMLDGEFKRKNSGAKIYHVESNSWLGFFLGLFFQIVMIVLVFRFFRALFRGGITMGGAKRGCLAGWVANSMLNSGNSYSNHSGWGSSSGGSDWGGFGGGGDGFNGGGAGGSW